MKLGFNWQRGPFEMIDAVGLERLAQMADEADMTLPHQLTERTSPYYKATADSLLVDIALLAISLSACQMGRCAFQ